MLNNIYNLRSIFHTIIITIFVLSVVGCGVKKNPYYEDSAPQADENVEFHIEKK